MLSRALRDVEFRVRAALVAVALAVPGIVLASSPARATDPCSPEGNPIACENSKPGSPPEEWDIWGAGDEGIQGFATEISVDVGNRIDFKVDTDASDYNITIYRTGWYGGLGAREITTVEPSAQLPQIQPECYSDRTTELYDCGNWGVSASWQVPADAVSGVYVALLERDDTAESSHITFVVRDDASHSDIVFQTADPTWHAYNRYGGSDFYQGAANGRAYKISYNRPFSTRGSTSGRDFYFSSEYAMVRFLERNGYDVSYISGVDADVRGNLLTNHETFLSVGHDEYWSGQQRANVEAAREAGVNLGFFAGNEVYWRTRWEDSTVGEQGPNRTLVSYKETWGNGKIDPSTEWTGTWRDPRFAGTDAGAGLPENGLTGTAYMSNFSDLPVTVSAQEGKYRLWRHTPLDSLAAGQSAELAPHTVGYESNEDLDNGFRPEGLIRLSTTVGDVPQYLQDFGNKVAAGRTTHHTTMYRAPSGALVFSTGSIQWSWGLDQQHDGNGAPADPRMQQATVNILADMSAQPSTLMAGLVQATASTDVTGPTTTITTPTAGQEIPNGTRVTATGTASDIGGRVAGVELSADGGTSWHPASGTTAWSYTYTQHGTGPYGLLARAVDDSANIGAEAAVEVGVTCPCSIFGDEVPAEPQINDSAPVELGLRFSTAIDGFASGVRFYKGVGNDGQHTGTLWSGNGQRLASVIFADEGAAGWQTAQFVTPVALTAGQQYVVSYTAPMGHYAAKAGAFWSHGITAEPLSVAGGFGAAHAGTYGRSGQFPTSSYNASHYYVDVVFNTVDDTPLTLSSQLPLPGSTSVPWGTAFSAVLSKPVTRGTVDMTVSANGDVIAGAVAYDETTRTVTFTPSEALAPATTFTAAVAAEDPQGAGIQGSSSWSVTTAVPDGVEGDCPCSLYNDSTTPAVLQGVDTAAVTLGVRFTSSEAGTVTGIRFYKAPGNTGSHTGTLWTEGGAVLATGTFTDESTQGWQTLIFENPVRITADTRYVASYRTQVGRYSFTAGSYADWTGRGPLRVPPKGATYTYGTGFPTASTSTSYMVDVVVVPDPKLLTISSTTPQQGAIGVPTDATVSASFSGPLPAAAQLQLTGAQGPVPGTSAIAAGARTLTFTPAAPLAQRQTYTAEITGTGGDSVTWSFETADATGCPCTVFTDEAPGTASENDHSRIELGMSFTPTVDGRITGVRFYKGSGNSGTHTGSLWTSGGSLLSNVEFTDESATGWQTAWFPTGVDVEAGTTYVVSYLAPAGGYAATADYFADGPQTNGPLTALGSNGRYRYGGGFPSSTYRSTNYFVDVVFEHGSSPVGVSATTPSPGATDVSVSTSVTASLSREPSATPVMALASAEGPVAGTSAYDAAARRATFTPAQALPYGTVLTATVTIDGTVPGGGTWQFTTATEPACPCTLFGTDVPSQITVAESSALELGVVVVPERDGLITGIRFYKGPQNTGTHTGSLWTMAGQRLATVTFTNETPSGWQEAALTQPVPVTAGTSYVASYFAPTGGFSRTVNYFSAPHVAGPLTAPAAGNGRYRYGAEGGFPDRSAAASNYFVDVIYDDLP